MNQREKSQTTLAMREAVGSLAQSPDVAVIVTDTSGITQWVNQAAERLTGYPFAELVGCKPGSILQFERTKHDAVVRMALAVRHVLPVSVELLNRRKDGTGYWTRLKIVPWRADSGEHKGFVSFQTDVTREKEVLEFALRSRERMLSKFSHELRTPLNAIVQLTDLIAATGQDPTQRENSLQCQTAAQGLLQLVNEVLDRASLIHQETDLPPKPTVLRELLARVKAVSSTKFAHKPIRFSTDTSFQSDDVPESFLLKAEKTYRVLLNLVSNALKYTQAGEVKLSAEVRRVVRGGPPWDVRFAVTDTGIGMTTAQMELLKNPFARVHDQSQIREQGTGLGLMLCDEEVRQMGSQLLVHSAPGQGSTFWFTLAVDAAPEAAAGLQAAERTAAESAGPLSLAGLRILLVDDNALGLSVGAKQLRRFGAEVVECGDGMEAYALVQGDRKPFSIILMDLQMPVMDGFEATRRIRQLDHGREVPVVALSAGDRSSELPAALAAGMKDMVTKPFAIAELAAVVVAHTTKRGN